MFLVADLREVYQLAPETLKTVSQIGFLTASAASRKWTKLGQKPVKVRVAGDGSAVRCLSTDEELSRILQRHGQCQ